MRQREDQVLTAVLTSLDLALQNKLTAKEALDCLETAINNSLQEDIIDREGWEFAEKRAGALFELCDQDLEFSSKVKWHNVEYLISSTKLLNKIRLKLATKDNCLETIKRWFITAIYECNVAYRFCKDGLVHEKQAVYIKESLKSTKRDFILLCSGFQAGEANRANKDNQMSEKSLELLSIIGLNPETLKVLKPDSIFIEFVPYWRDYKLILDLFDSYVATQLALGNSSVDSLGELTVSIFLFRKYQARNLAKENISESSCIDLVIKACDKLILEDQNADRPLESFVMFKTFLEAVNPYEVNLADRFECLYKIKSGDFKELLKYKQSLNLSNPADILFDLLIDLFRMGLPSTNAAPSVAVLLHKLSTPGVSQLLTVELLTTCKQYFEGSSNFAYLLLLHASISHNNQLVGLFLQSVTDWATSTRERIRAKEIPTQSIREFFSQVGLKRAESVVIRDGRVALTEHRAAFLKCCYLCFYLAKLVGDRPEALHCLQTLFKLANGCDNLWTINEESGSFFLDIIQILLPDSRRDHQVHSTMDIERDSCEEESKTILNFVGLLCERRESDSPRVKAFKSILHLKLGFAQTNPNESISWYETIRAIFSALPFEDVCSALKTELTSPAVYYTFFFQTIGSYLESSAEDPSTIRNVIQMMICLYEEMLENDAKNAAITIFPVLCQKASQFFEGVLDRCTGTRLAIHLFNIWIEQRDFATIEMAFKVSGGMNSQVKTIVAAYLFELAKSKQFEQCSKSFFSDVAAWITLELATSKPSASGFTAAQCQPNLNNRMDVEKSEKLPDELDLLEHQFHKDQAEEKAAVVELSRSQLLYIQVINSYHMDPGASSATFSNFLSKEANSLTDDEYAALLYATSGLSDKALQSQLLRHYLSKMLSSGKSETPKLLEIYTSLLDTTDSVRELKTYLIQMEGVIEMANPADRRLTPSELKSLVLQLAKVKADFMSLSEQIARVATLIDKKWAGMCSEVKGLDRMLSYVKEGYQGC